MDCGLEFVSNALDNYNYLNNIKLEFSNSGKLVGNAFIESFNGSLRDGLRDPRNDLDLKIRTGTMTEIRFPMIEKDKFIDYLMETPNFISVFIYSIFYNIASLILLDISYSTSLVVTDVNLIFTFFTVGAIIGQLTSVIYNKRFNKMYVVIAGYLLIIPVIITLTLNSNLIVFYILYFISGYVLGVIFIKANEFVLENKIKNKDRVITILLIFYPIGAMIAPLLTSNIVRMGISWRFSFYIIIFLIIINIFLYIFIYRKTNHNVSLLIYESINFRSSFTERTKNLAYVLIFFAVLFYDYSETIVATWTPTFLRQTKNFDIKSSSFVLTFFWLFMIIGRGIILAIAGRIKANKILFYTCILAIVAFSGIIFLKSEYYIYILIAFTGIGYSALPLLISTGSTLYEKGRGVTATGLFIASNIGVSLAPFITKYTSKVGMIFSVSFAVMTMAVVFFLSLFIHVLLLKRNSIKNS